MPTEMETFSKLLALAKCLKGFGYEDLRELLKISSKAIWQPDETVFDEGSGGRDMYIICSGKVNIWRKNDGVPDSAARRAGCRKSGRL